MRINLEKFNTQIRRKIIYLHRLSRIIFCLESVLVSLMNRTNREPVIASLIEYFAQQYCEYFCISFSIIYCVFFLVLYFSFVCSFAFVYFFFLSIYLVLFISFLLFCLFFFIVYYFAFLFISCSADIFYFFSMLYFIFSCQCFPDLTTMLIAILSFLSSSMEDPPTMSVFIIQAIVRRVAFPFVCGVFYQLH